jgi:hypothetical protein
MSARLFSGVTFFAGGLIGSSRPSHGTRAVGETQAVIDPTAKIAMNT